MFSGQSRSLRWSAVLLAAVLLLVFPAGTAIALLPETIVIAAAPAVSVRAHDAGAQKSACAGFAAATPARAPPA